MPPCGRNRAYFDPGRAVESNRAGGRTALPTAIGPAGEATCVSTTREAILWTPSLDLLKIFEAAGVEVRLLPVRNGVDGFDWYDEPIREPQVAAQSELAESVAEMPAVVEPAEAEEAEEETPLAEPELEPVAAEVKEEVAAEIEVDSIPDDEESPDKSEWMKADVAEPEEDADAESSWDEDDDLRLAEDDLQPAYANSATSADFKTRWWEDDGAAA